MLKVPEFLAKAQQTHGLYVNSVAFLPCAEHRHRSPYLRGFYNQLHKPAISGVLAEVPLIDKLSGAFSAGGGSVGAGTADSSISFWKHVNFNASRSNSAYKGSTVQPPALLTLVAIRY